MWKNLKISFARFTFFSDKLIICVNVNNQGYLFKYCFENNCFKFRNNCFKQELFQKIDEYYVFTTKLIYAKNKLKTFFIAGVNSKQIIEDKILTGNNLLTNNSNNNNNKLLLLDLDFNKIDYNSSFKFSSVIKKAIPVDLLSANKVDLFVVVLSNGNLYNVQFVDNFIFDIKLINKIKNISFDNIILSRSKDIRGFRIYFLRNNYNCNNNNNYYDYINIGNTK